ASGSWADTSADQGRGWIGEKVTLAPGESREIDVAVVGGFDAFAGATGTYDAQMDGALDWFIAGNMAEQQALTEAHWQDWLAGGVQFDSPE
ncbi:MAG TPA: hypothetical protein DEB06_00320, partial [Phycisphaerales bacterium]|nr:hypothetical protein [Phycisphaerales bacterium]